MMTVAMAAAIALAATAAAAGHSWQYTVDLAAISEHTYAGSDERYLSALPAVGASRTSGATTFFLHLPFGGLGLSHVHRATGLRATLSANFGGERGPRDYSVFGFSQEHDRRTQQLLAGSPTVSTPVCVEAKLEYPLASGILGARLGYHPSRIEFADAARADETRHGLLLSLQYLRPVQVTDRLVLAGSVGLEVMDASYAGAWFGVDQATAELARFDADAGLRDVEAAVHASYRLSPQVSLSLYYRGMLLLADAAASPYTVERYQQTYLLGTSYTF